MSTKIDAIKYNLKYVKICLSKIRTGEDVYLCNEYKRYRGLCGMGFDIYKLHYHIKANFIELG